MSASSTQPAGKSIQVSINNLHAALESLQKAPGGDLGGLRATIEPDVAAAIETIVKVHQTQNSGRSRGSRGRGAATPRLGR